MCVYFAGPAARKGLKVNDTFAYVDGVDIRGLPREHLQMALGSSLTFKIFLFFASDKELGVSSVYQHNEREPDTRFLLPSG